MNEQNGPYEYIFVYGSLMAGVRSRVAQTFHAQSEFVSTGQVRGRLYDLGQYPGLVLGRAENYVQGHIFRILNTEVLLPFLDEYEGLLPDDPAASEYRRQAAEVEAAARSYRCWMYLYNQVVDDLRLIESGDYLTYLETSPAHLEFLKSLRANG